MILNITDIHYHIYFVGAVSDRLFHFRRLRCGHAVAQRETDYRADIKRFELIMHPAHIAGRNAYGCRSIFHSFPAQLFNVLPYGIGLQKGVVNMS